MITDRRKFLKASALSGLSMAFYAPNFIFSKDKNNIPDKKNNTNKDSLLVTPTFPQMEWQDSEFGIIFHFDISVATNNISGDNDVRKTFNLQDYNPSKLDTDQWLRTAKEAGASYAVFTATHFGGFLQWQSDLYPYGLKQAKWKNGKGDIVADFIKSCYKYNIKPGLYLSTHRNAYWQVDNHYVDWGKGKDTPQQKAFNHVSEEMTEELCSRYGRLLEIWFDAGVKTPSEGGPDVLPIFEKYQPNGLFYNSSQRSDFRWVGNENGFADYPCWATMPAGAYSHNAQSWKSILGKGTPDGGVWSPAMVDIPLRGANGVHSWFWRPGQENGVYSLQQLNKIYEQSVGRNSDLVIGTVINPDGLVPEKDAHRLAEFGKTLKKEYSNPLVSTKGEGNHFAIQLKQPASLKKYVLQEDIQFGERVQSYILKGQMENGIWIEIDKGSCIGHKRIAQIIQPEKFRQIELKITESKDMAFIREFAIF